MVRMMRNWIDIVEGCGRIIQGVNTTDDVGVDQTRIEAEKFGFDLDADGVPMTLTQRQAKMRED